MPWWFQAGGRPFLRGQEVGGPFTEQLEEPRQDLNFYPEDQSAVSWGFLLKLRHFPGEGFFFFKVIFYLVCFVFE